MFGEINCWGFYLQLILWISLWRAEDAGGSVGLRACALIRPTPAGGGGRDNEDFDLGRWCCRITRSANPTYAPPHKSVDVKKAAQGDFDYHVISALLVEVSGS